LIRDPRDTVSSLYFFVKFRLEYRYAWLANKSDFVRSKNGLPLAVWHLNEWARKIHVVKEPSIIRFEHLSGLYGKHYFRRVCRFSGLNTSSKTLDLVFDKWTPNTVEKWENRKAKLVLFRSNPNKALSFNEKFCRRASVGAAAEDLPEEDLHWMDQYIEENLSDDYEFYKYDSRWRREGISSSV
jgi:hypothetical protein